MAEGAARSGQGIVGVTGLQGDAVDLLHAVGNTDGEDQKRHQHRIGVKPETHHMHQPQLPHHRNQGRAQHGDGAAKAAGEPNQQYQRDQEGDAEEHHHHDQAIDQVADFLGEPDDVNLHIGVLRFELGADFLFKLVREIAVIQREQMPLIFRVRVRLQQRDVDDARLEVVSHQTPDLAGLEHVVAQQVEAGIGPVVTLRDDFTTGKAFFGHFGPAHAGAPQRFQSRAVDAGDVEHFVVDLTQGLHVLLGKDVAVDRFHRDAHGVAQVGQVVAVFEHLLNERMLKRDHFFEAGGRPHQGRLPEQKNTDQQANADHHRAVVEDQAFEQRRFIVMRQRLMVGHCENFLALIGLIVGPAQRQ